MPAKVNSASGSALICEHKGEAPAGILPPTNPWRCGLMSHGHRSLCGGDELRLEIPCFLWHQIEGEG